MPGRIPRRLQGVDRAGDRRSASNVAWRPMAPPRMQNGEALQGRTYQFLYSQLADTSRRRLELRFIGS